jgi:hypothetical protein
VIAYAYAPERLFARFRYQVDATYLNRLRLRQRASSPGLTSNAAWRLAQDAQRLFVEPAKRRGLDAIG